MPVTGNLAAIFNGMPLFTFIEEGFQPIKKAWLSDEEYEKVLRSKVLANTDFVMVNSARRVFYLAWRKSLPMTGWFWMGGNTGDINAPMIERLRSVIERETKLSIAADRLVLRGIVEYFWKDRAQAPTDIGCHMAALTASIDITAEEAKNVVLDPEEYDTGKLREFTREDLVRENVVPSILALYDHVFPPLKASTFGHMVLVHEDDRRRIWESKGETYSTQLFEIKESKVPLGKHAHGKNFEVFTIIRGGGFVLTCQVDANGHAISAVEKKELQPKSSVRFEPFTAHTFYLTPGSEMLCYSSNPDNPSDFIPAPYLVADN